MSDIKQTNFRLSAETADAFRKFCEDNDITHAQGFDHVMQVFELNQAKTVVASRATEIESFEKSVKDIMDAYLLSLKICQDAEERIREQFASDLDRKDKTIGDLQAKAEQLKAAKDAAEAAAAEAKKVKERAEKEAATAEKLRESAEKTAEDRKIIADTLASKLAEAEKKSKGFDDLQTQITILQNNLQKARAEANEAKQEAKTAKLTAIAELTQAHKAEVDKIQEKLDARTEELMRVKQEFWEKKIALLETERVNQTTTLEQPIETNPDNIK